MVFSKKNLLMLSLLVSGAQTMQAMNLKSAVLGAMILSSADARKYHVRNASDKVMVLEYTCPDHTSSASMIAPLQSFIAEYFPQSSSKPSKSPKTETKFDVTLWPGDSITISKCDRIDSMKAYVQAGQYPFNYDDINYYAGSLTYNSLYTYRTFKMMTGVCKNHHWCDSFGYDKTSALGRDFGVQLGEPGWPYAPSDDYVALAQNQTESNTTRTLLMQEIKRVGNLRGSNNE